VTPSDIIVGGEEAIERRARAVFEALTLLTRVVILFDEFDPVLWKRDPGDATPRSVFTFLTPAMLPKLKDLRRWAKKRSCAFALSTNLIGGLDPAAVREGRFDVKLGIYPPDPLSRAGRLLNQMDTYLVQKDIIEALLARPDSVQQRVLDVVKSTDGGAMETLAKAGWFKAPKPSDATRLKDNRLAPKNGPLEPFAYLFNGVGGATCKKVTREANLKDPVEDPTAILEFVQWWWIQQLDENLPSEIGADEKFDDIFRKATSATHAKLMPELVAADRRNRKERTHDTLSRIRK
jgi:SpoVK/Ycf46/Vps4 family AAA+-type ATPase